MDVRATLHGAVGKAAELSKPAEIVVFWLVSDSVCAECGEGLGKGRFLRLDRKRPLCLACADLDRLVFLERGDAALTRRASRYSTLRAVVVRFSRARKQYEQQGVLVDEEALARAEQECLSDAEARQRARLNGVRHSMSRTWTRSHSASENCFPGVPMTSDGPLPNTRARSIRAALAGRRRVRSSKPTRPNLPCGRTFGTGIRDTTNSWDGT